MEEHDFVLTHLGSHLVFFAKSHVFKNPPLLQASTYSKRGKRRRLTLLGRRRRRARRRRRLKRGRGRLKRRRGRG